jgi:hypothetical protein
MSDRGCRAKAEVGTPDAALRDIWCEKFKRGHGRWHENRQVRWRGRYIYPENIGEASERLLREALRATSEDEVPLDELERRIGDDGVSDRDEGKPPPIQPGGHMGQKPPPRPLPELEIEP